jgi:hypothetical protein
LYKSKNCVKKDYCITYLNDKLGGICSTELIAIISTLTDDIGDSLGTCHFARTVQMIKNEIKRYDTLDPGVIIRRHK